MGIINKALSWRYIWTQWLWSSISLRFRFVVHGRSGCHSELNLFIAEKHHYVPWAKPHEGRNKPEHRKTIFYYLIQVELCQMLRVSSWRDWEGNSEYALNLQYTFCGTWCLLCKVLHVLLDHSLNCLIVDLSVCLSHFTFCCTIFFLEC